MAWEKSNRSQSSIPASISPSSKVNRSDHTIGTTTEERDDSSKTLVETVEDKGLKTSPSSPLTAGRNQDKVPLASSTPIAEQKPVDTIEVIPDADPKGDISLQKELEEAKQLIDKLQRAVHKAEKAQKKAEQDLEDEVKREVRAKRKARRDLKKQVNKNTKAAAANKKLEKQIEHANQELQGTLDGKRQQVTTGCIKGMELNDKDKSTFKKNVYIPIPPPISPYLRYMPIIVKLDPGPRPKIFDVQREAFFRPTLKYYQKDVDERVTKFNRAVRRLISIQQAANCTGCQRMVGVKPCLLESKMTDEHNVRYCTRHFYKIKAHGGLYSIRKTKDVDEVEIYMSPDIYLSKYTTDDSELHKDLGSSDFDFEKFRHALQKNYVEDPGHVYNNPGDGKGLFFSKARNRSLVNVGFSKDLVRREKGKIEELKADMQKAFFYGQFSETQKVERMIHGVLKAQGYWVQLNDKSHLEYFDIRQKKVFAKMQLAIEPLYAYRPDIVSHYKAMERQYSTDHKQK